MIIQCPNCHRSLRVPDESAGRAARCRGCEHKFVITSPADELEDTISGWIVEDVRDIQNLKVRHQKLQQQ